MFLIQAYYGILYVVFYAFTREMLVIVNLLIKFSFRSHLR